MQLQDGNTWHCYFLKAPHSIGDPEGDRWRMYVTVRVSGEQESNAGGCVGFAPSQDGYEWRPQPPVFSGGYGQLEVPQIFEVYGKWCSLFCAADEHFSKEQAALTRPVTGHHYVIGEGPGGAGA